MTVLLFLTQIASLAVAIIIGRRSPQRIKGLIAGVLAGLGVSIATGFALGFLGNIVPMGQLEFWFATKLTDVWLFLTGNRIGG